MVHCPCEADQQCLTGDGTMIFKETKTGRLPSVASGRKPSATQRVAPDGMLRMESITTTDCPDFLPIHRIGLLESGTSLTTKTV